MDPLDLFRANTSVHRKFLKTPSSQRYVPTSMKAIDQELELINPKGFFEGKDYVEQFVKEEEQKLLTDGHNSICKEKDKFDEVSQGTSGVFREIQNELLVNIYKTYNFAYRPKDNLPISNMKDKIVSMVDTNPVVVIQGHTGCGKTTQVPQFLLDNSYNKKVPCNIIVTQPRRIAAISIAQRVSKERNWPLGTLVGYQVGMCNTTSQDTRLTYCTAGVLLRKLILNKNMLEYTHVILDEVHERSQDMDFLLLVIRKLLRSNSRSVKVILMSATFDVDRFASYFSSLVGKELIKAPIVDVSKRNRFKINTFYLCQMSIIGQLPDVIEAEPHVSKEMMEFCAKTIIVLDNVDKNSENNEEEEEDEQYESVDENEEEGEGEFKRHVILVFLPGIMEIEEMHDMLKAPKHEKLNWDVVVMHSSITSEEQQRIFQKPPRGHRRIILSTNISESSITVPDVKYVIDFCLTKQLVINPQTNFQSLELAWASKANCEQRAGRTGRVMDGRVYRLVPKRFYEICLPKEGDPEMLRAPLENLVLNTKILDMGEPKSLLALSLDPPDLSNLKRTILILKETGALFNCNEKFNDCDGELTDLGRIMAALPMDIRISKLIALGHAFSILKDSIIVGASMTVKSMFSNPFQKKLQAYNAKLSWADTSCSDCIASLNVFKVWQQEKASRRITNSATEKEWARRHFVQIRSLREIDHLARDVTRRLQNMRIVETVGKDRVVWSDTERAFVQKIVIAGAFYPNYFVKSINNRVSSGKESLKVVSGMDPAKSVYLQGWPANQPGILYAKRIQGLFSECTPSSVAKVSVSFDISSRVYINFWSKEKHLGRENQAPDVTGKISLAVYRAVKLRKIHSGITMRMLDDQSAMEAAKDLKLISDKKPAASQQKGNFDHRPILPGLDMTVIPLKITEIIDPGHFWAQMIDEEQMKRLDTLIQLVNKMDGFLVEADSEPKAETLVFAPFSNRDRSYHRAVIQSISRDRNIKIAHVLFIDCGRTGDVNIVDLRLLRQFSELEVDLRQEFNVPALAFECVLANIRPTFMSNKTGQWAPQARKDLEKLLISERGQQKYLFGEIFSVVHSVVSLTLFCKSGEKTDTINVNDFLVQKKYAEPREESFLSKSNNEIRKSCVDMALSQKTFYEEAQYDTQYSSEVYPDPPDERDCGKSIVLRGPFSPLEIELMHLTTAGAAKKVKIEGTSVNSVLLDTSPDDHLDRLLVSGSVSETPSGEILTLRDTTLMPNVPGLTSIISLLFSSRMELRRNTSQSYYIGALCGLGAHPETGLSLFPEHDMDIKFDVNIDLNDLLLINKLRHWMNIALSLEPEGTDESDTIQAQVRLKEYLFELMDKKRDFHEQEVVAKFNRWNLYPQGEFLAPGRFTFFNKQIFPLHYALELVDENPEIKILRANQNELLELVRTDIRNRRKVNTTCLLCRQDICGIMELRTHLFSREHHQALEAYSVL